MVSLCNTVLNWFHFDYCLLCLFRFVLGFDFDYFGFILVVTFDIVLAVYGLISCC